MNVIGTFSAGDPSTTIPQPRLVQAAHEFEAQLMKELLKPMTAGTTLDGDQSDSGSGATLGDFASEALGQSISRHGGLGIATSILHSLSRNEKTNLDASQTGNGAAISAQIAAMGLK